MSSTDPSADAIAEIANRAVITVSRARSKRVTGWMANCSKCGIVGNVVLPKKASSERLADRHSRAKHSGQALLRVQR